MHRRIAMVVATAVPLTLAMVAQASGSTCTYSPAAPPTVDFNWTQSGDYVTGANGPTRFPFDPTGKIYFFQTDCGAATVFNTDLIRVTNASVGPPLRTQFNVPVTKVAGFLAPGATDEPGESDEVELELDFRDSRGESPSTYDDLVFNTGFTEAATVRIGSSEGVGYANVNAAETTGIDQDVSFQGVRDIRFNGSYGNDDVRASGGLGTGNPLVGYSVRLSGLDGDDNLVGGESNDNIDGEKGNDTLVGGLGNDLITGGPGNDLIYGNAGEDDLLDGGPGSDTIIGGSGNDGGGATGAAASRRHSLPGLVGGPAHDVLAGKRGADTLRGGGGPDTLRGGPGRDLLLGGSGNDRLIGGPGVDVCKGGPGRDRLVGCEIAIP
jgi:Ca2+-binding RTX toxin-like protein